MSNQTPESAVNRRTITRRAVVGGGLGVLLSAGGAGAWALNRFVIDHVEVENASSYEAQQAAASGNTEAAASAAPGSVSGLTYSSDAAQIAITKKSSGSGSDLVTWFVADLKFADATALRSAFAEDKFGTNIVLNPSDIASAVGAVVAVNGDYYGFRDTGIVIRNGVTYRDLGARQGLAVYRDGTMKLYDETTTNAKSLVFQGVWQTLSFGPGIVENGSIVAGIDSIEIDTNFGNHSIQGNQPRTGIGWVDTNHLLIIVVDGRSMGYSRGVSMTEFAQIFQAAGAQVAYNLDGGGSSTMWFNGSVVNNPLGRGQERGTSDILYVGG